MRPDQAASIIIRPYVTENTFDRIEKENKLVFGALVQLRELEVYVKKLQIPRKKNESGILPQEKYYLSKKIDSIKKRLKASL